MPHVKILNHDGLTEVHHSMLLRSWGNIGWLGMNSANISLLKVCLSRDSNEGMDYTLNGAFASVPCLSREAHPRLCSIAVMLLWQLKSSQTNLAALLWTIPFLLMGVMMCMSHIVEEYWMIGLTRVLYPNS